MKKFFDKFQTLKGVSFVGLNNYVAKTTGEVANHVINVNLSVENAKKTDLERLLNCKVDDLSDVLNTASGFTLTDARTALSEMIESAKRNLSENQEDRTAQSKGQNNAFIHLTPAIKLHKETMTVHIFGQSISKTVLIPGQYKTVNSSSKTLAKKAITKFLDLRSDKFRDFIVGNFDEVRIAGETIVMP